MPYSLKIDEVLECAFIKWHGVFSWEEHRIYGRETADEASFQKCPKRFHDARRVVFDIPAPEVHRVARSVTSRNDTPGMPWSVILVSSELGLDVMRMFATMSDLSGMNLNVFRELKEAKAWLGLPADVGDPFKDMPSD